MLQQNRTGELSIVRASITQLAIATRKRELTTLSGGPPLPVPVTLEPLVVPRQAILRVQLTSSVCRPRRSLKSEICLFSVQAPAARCRAAEVFGGVIALQLQKRAFS